MVSRVPLFVPLVAIAVGSLIALIGALRPAFVWTLGNIELGRRWFGDDALATTFMGSGGVFVAIGIVLILRR